MTFIKPQDTVRQMNKCSKEHIPFLFAFDFELKNSIFVSNPLQQKNILFRTPQCNNSPIGSQILNTKLITNPIEFKEYKKQFDIVKNGLYRGDSFLTNLTIQTPISCNASLFDIFHTSRVPYCLFIPNKFVCFSPEIFVRINNNTISTYPMKGTIDATIENAEQKILNDPKETAEHTTVVDLLRNDIGINAKNVKVNRFRYIDRIDTPFSSILQVSSEIIGTLPNNYNEKLGDIILSMLPAGSISGAPKKATLNLIRQAEKTPRGFYSGVFGYFDGQNLDSAVLIRYIEQIDGQLFFRSGGGITVNSDCKSEYEEVIKKIYIPTI